jgi:hypothetical protein
MHTRRRFGAAVLVAALLLAGTGRAEAAFITWGSATDITGDSNVKTDGTLFGALNMGGSGTGAASAQTVNGVPFTAANITNIGSDTFGNFQFTASGLNSLEGTGTSIGSSSSFFTNLSSGYQGLLSTAALNIHVNIGTPMFTLTISGLTVGDQYEFEWWDNDSRASIRSATLAASDSGGHSVTLSNSSNTTSGGLGKYAVGTFTADATTEVITFSTSDAGIAQMLNALQLRDITPTVTSVPEPASVIPLLTGALGLLGYGWRRRKQVA